MFSYAAAAIHQFSLVHPRYNLRSDAFQIISVLISLEPLRHEAS